METLTLKAETSRLLDLVIHSLYTRPEVFLRELVSNASDALDRFRLDAMLTPEVDDKVPLEIRLEVNASARTLTIRDNGIGMTHDEVLKYIGTIASSGTREVEAQLKARPDHGQTIDLIGHFGVGFYSCFMVADRVTLVTRRMDEPLGTQWESEGDVQYTLTDAADVARGTSITLKLKPVDREAGIEDYSDRWILSRIVKRYADFVTYPIVYVRSPGEASGVLGAEPAVALETIVLNSMKPMWTRAGSEIKPEEYVEFYRHISQDLTDPLMPMLFKAEGRWEYAALLFVPSEAPYDLYYHGFAYGLQLYSQRMLIVENCSDLLPRYLRFLKGVVDVADVPLNVSRQTLQHAHHLASIRKWLTKKVIDALSRLANADPDNYLTLWRHFGRALKEGVSEDHDNKDRLVPLLLFESSFDDAKLTTLAQYVSRMKEGQQDIFYLAGESRGLIERSPHLEGLHARDYEVLYLTQPVDELVTQALHEFEGHRLRSAAKGQLDPTPAQPDASDEDGQKQAAALADLLEALAKHLEDKVRDVRVSKRLTVSPACLAGEEFDISPHIERLLKQNATTHRRTLELNPKHPIVSRLQAMFTKNAADPAIKSAAHMLFGLALLAEGSELPNPAAFSSQVTDLLAHSLGAALAP